MDFGIVGVAAISVLCYAAGEIIKVLPWNLNRAIPAVCAVIGLCLGLIAFFCGIPDFPADNWLTAAAVGVVSGLAATGANQIGKQIGKEE